MKKQFLVCCDALYEKGNEHEKQRKRKIYKKNELQQAEERKTQVKVL